MEAIPFVKAIVLSLLVAVPSMASQTAQPGRASYRVQAGSSAGSGTGISDHLLVTNNHVAGQVGQTVTMRNNVTGGQAQGHVLMTDSAADLSIIYTGDELEWVPVSPNGIDDAQEITRYSWGGSGRLVRIACRLLHRRSNFKNNGRGTYATVSRESISGDSGGGMFQENQLVAVLWGTGPSHTVGAETQYLHPMVQAYDTKHKTNICHQPS